ncbi:MAG: hypothetical protein AAF961_11125, partial [Planctomycetota bacterium]
MPHSSDAVDPPSGAARDSPSSVAGQIAGTAPAVGGPEPVDGLTPEVGGHAPSTDSLNGSAVGRSGDGVSPRAVKTPTAVFKSTSRESIPALVDVGDLTVDAPAWLVSAIVHILILIALALFLVTQPQTRNFVLRLDPSSDGDDLQTGDFDLPLELDQPLADESDALDPQLIESTRTNDSFLDPAAMPVSPFGQSLRPDTPAIRMALSGREAGMRDALLAAYGGTAGTQDAVMEALRWLTRNQISKSGLWSLTGPYSNGASQDNPDAATALALLAFQGAGYTPESVRSDPFTKVVARGWNALLKRQQDNGNFFTKGRSHGRLYTHAIATIAVCELYGMTQNSAYREAAQRAIDYSVETQGPDGGWRYSPAEKGDLSVTGWFVMALQSARMAGLDVPPATLYAIEEFLDRCSVDGGSQYSYRPGEGKRLSMTAEGLLCRQYLGWSQSDPRLQRGAKILLENVPDWNKREAYYWYYASQVCHHIEGETWRKWNASMRTVLPENQIRSGRERGSWDPSGDGSVGMSGGGRLFITCLSTY